MRFAPQQVLDEIFAGKDSNYNPDREDFNSLLNEALLQSNKEDEDEADDKTVKEL